VHKVGHRVTFQQLDPSLTTQFAMYPADLARTTWFA
jgi:hypothetical protein